MALKAAKARAGTSRRLRCGSGSDGGLPLACVRLQGSRAGRRVTRASCLPAADHGDLRAAEEPAIPGRGLGVPSVDDGIEDLSQGNRGRGLLGFPSAPDDRQPVNDDPRSGFLGGDPAPRRQPPRRLGEDREELLIVPVAPLIQRNVLFRAEDGMDPQLLLQLSQPSRPTALGRLRDYIRHLREQNRCAGVVHPELETVISSGHGLAHRTSLVRARSPGNSNSGRWQAERPEATPPPVPGCGVELATQPKPSDVCPTCNGHRIIASRGGTCPRAPATHSVNLGCLPATCPACDGTGVAH